MTSIFESNFRHCPFCGGLLTRNKTPFLRLSCIQCSRVHYLNPKVGVAMVVEYDNGIVLARRADEPYKDYWMIPSGYVEYEESCEAAAIREAEEELGVTIEICSLQNVYSFMDDPRAHMVLIVYICKVVAGELKAGSDVSEVKVFCEHNLPEQIAFSGVQKAISDYWRTRNGNN
jgi:8-oxo-dGTP diphosphatase